MLDYEDRPYVVVERRPGTLRGFFWGALLGTGVALLFAPRSGKETRRELQDSARKLRERAEDAARQVQESVVDSVDSVRRQVEEGMDAARRAVDTGREAARETRSELERRVRESTTHFHAGVEAVRGGGDKPEAPPASPGAKKPEKKETDS